MAFRIYMLVYILYLVLVLLISLYTFRHKFKVNEVYIILINLILIGALIAAIRPSISQDTNIYNLIYQESYSIMKSAEIRNIGSFFANRSYYSVELFYILIMSIFRCFFKTPIIFYFIHGIVSNFCMIYGIFLLCEYLYNLDTKEKKIKFIEEKLIRLFALYFMFCGVLYTSSAVRDGLSISVGLIAIGNLLLCRKRILSIVLIMLSILIHTKSIIFVPVFLLLYFWKYILSKNMIYFLSLSAIALYFCKIGKRSVPFFTKIISRILQLFNIQAFYSYITNLDFQLPMREGMIIVITCFLIIISYKNDRKFSKYFCLTMCGVFMFIFAYPIPALARIMYIFIIFLFPVIINDSKYEKFIFLLATLYLVPQLVYVFGYIKI